MRVAVAEDDPDLAEVVLEWLEGGGCNVGLASNGLDLLRVLHEVHPDVLLLDLGMQPVNGWEILDALQSIRRYADVPVVVMTGSPAWAVDGPLRRYGQVREVLHKPFADGQLLDAVARAAA